jgi:16S rRNA (uracil1498-N3)-methyltransferase
MTEPLFYSERLAEPGATLALTGDEARHAAASRRLRVGDTLWLFDGHGGVARATVLNIAAPARELDLRIEERRTEPAPQPSIHLACALPKGDRQGTLLDMAVQLGMTQFTPLECGRSVVKPGTGSAERWRRICLEACKQSRRTHLPVIHSPATPLEAVNHSIKRGGAVWMAHPCAQAIPVASAVEQTVSADVTILVGPEGGFTEEEVAQANVGGARLLVLRSAILRIETAAVALIAAFALAAEAERPKPGGA